MNQRVFSHIYDTYGSVRDRIFKFSCSNDGYLSTYSSKIGEKLEIISNGIGCPTNRDSFAFCQLDDDNFFITGGVGHGIEQYEIWQFCISKKTWTPIINSGCVLKRRQKHCSICFVSRGTVYIYTFGGIRSFSFYDSLLIQTIQGSSFSHISLISERDWPTNRVFHTMVLGNNMAYLFGGIAENGNLLSDLWALDLSLFPLQPKWELVQNEGPASRHSHVSWIDGDLIYIAGGIDSAKKPLNDIWLYKNKWQQTHIFETVYPVFPCMCSLCQISESLEKVNTRSPFAALDSLFNDLRHNQKLYTKRSEHLRSRSEEFNEATPEYISNRIVEVKEKISLNINDLSKNVGKLNIVTQPKINESINIFAEILTQKLKEHEKSYRKKKNNYELEIKFYKEQLSNLKNLSEKEANIPTLSIFDFSTFQEYMGSLDKSKQFPVLNHYYYQQLLGYHSISSRTNKLREKFRSFHQQILHKNETISKFSHIITYKYKKLRSIEVELENWKTLLVSLQNDSSIAHNYHQFISQPKKTAIDNPPNLKDLETELKLVMLKNKDHISTLYRHAKELSESIKEVSDSNVRKMIQNAAPTLIGYKNQIIQEGK